jgi:NAD(P)-dependent dehydrogenase (short-subunit alcohol dehydrogenase family)
VTGAAVDIGRAVAALLAARGWKLTLVDHPAALDGLDETMRACPLDQAKHVLDVNVVAS